MQVIAGKDKEAKKEEAKHAAMLRIVKQKNTDLSRRAKSAEDRQELAIATERSRTAQLINLHSKKLESERQAVAEQVVRDQKTVQDLKKVVSTNRRDHDTAIVSLKTGHRAEKKRLNASISGSKSQLTRMKRAAKQDRSKFEILLLAASTLNKSVQKDLSTATELSTKRLKKMQSSMDDLSVARQSADDAWLADSDSQQQIREMEHGRKEREKRHKAELEEMQNAHASALADARCEWLEGLEEVARPQEENEVRLYLHLLHLLNAFSY